MATIGIDVTALTVSASGGIGISQYETMRALAGLDSGHSFIMYSTSRPLVPFTDRPVNIRWPIRLASGPAARSNIVWMQTGVNRQLKADGVDLFWSPRHLLPFGARSVAKVATVQDFWHLHHPEQQPWLNRTMNALLIRRILRVSDRIVTTSRAVADDAVKHYQVAPQRISVIPLGVNAATYHRVSGERSAPVLDHYGIPGRFVLAMDVYNPRKNFAAVLDAFSRLPEPMRADLMLVGLGRPRKTAEGMDPRAIAERLGIRESLRLPGDVTREELPAFYATAEAFVYPSVYEGFGMPILEAMACGCPVVCGDGSSLPEVAGEAALLVRAEDPAQIAAALARVMGEPATRERLVEAGLARASAMTWEASASGLLRVFEDVLRGRER